VPLYAWIALAIFVAGLLAGCTWAGIKGYRFWRHGWPRLKEMQSAAEELSVATEELERRMAALEQKTAQLQHDTERLTVSLARARILLGAVEEAKEVLDRVRMFVPRQ
jgi:hypothetical protein